MLLHLCSFASGEDWPKDANGTVFEKVMKVCAEDRDLFSCLSRRLAKALSRVITYDVPLFDGMIFKYNPGSVEKGSEYQLNSAPADLTTTISQFLDSHVLTLDFSEARGSDGVFGGGGYGGMLFNRRNRRHLYYAFLAVLSVFGLSGPLLLKGLALIAGKALLASKAALIIIGSVAMKKIFQNDKDSSSKVYTHTVPMDDHDRWSPNYNTGMGYH